MNIIYTSYFILVYILSTNAYFIDILTFSFNPSKLFLLFTLPFFLFFSKNTISINKVDILFLLFICFSIIRFFVYYNIQEVTQLTNFVIPYIFYITMRSKMNNINIITVIYIILMFCSLHAALGLIQFYTGDKDFLLINHVQEWKIRYAQDFFFNPFEKLLLLPQGLYAYSSVLAISLIFPLYLLFSLSKIMPKIISYILFSLYTLTIFLTFSRFEILSIFILILFNFFIIKNNKIFLTRFFVVYVFIVFIIILYMSLTSDQLGTAGARVVTFNKLEIIFFNIKSLIFGVKSILEFREQYNMDIPHNMYIFLAVKYGILSAVLFISFIFIKVIKYISYIPLIEKNSHNQKIYYYMILFLLFLLFYRAFDYYIIDGYENILLFFYIFLILDTFIKKTPKKEKNVLHNNSRI